MKSLVIVSVAICAVISVAIVVTHSLIPLLFLIIVFFIWCGFEVDFKCPIQEGVRVKAITACKRGAGNGV